MIGGLSLCLCLSPAFSAAPADAPPDLLSARFSAPDRIVVTPGLQPGHERPTRNDELETALRALAARPGGPQLIEAGRSQRGTPLLAVRFGGAETGRPTALLVAQQHGDEPAGAEALLALATSLAEGVAADLLQQIDIVLLPRANPDGAALGVRNAADGIDINRDHLLLRTPEARAVTALAVRFAPLLVVDLHEYRVSARYLSKFGGVQRADLLLQAAATANLPPAVSAAAESNFRQPLLRALAQAGFSSDAYHVDALDPLDLRLAEGSVQPDNLRNVQGLRHAVSFLLESRGVGLGLRHLQRRVQSHLTALRSLLASAAEHAAALTAVRATADADVVAAACKGRVRVLVAQTAGRRDLTLIDPVTGADRTLSVEWLSAAPLRPLIERSRPCAYWLEASAAAAVAQLRALGLRVEPLAAPEVLRIEPWQERFDLGSARAGLRLIQATTRAEVFNAPAGSFRVPLAQPLANLAVAALEPDTPYSDFANRLLPQLSSAARVMEGAASAPARTAEQGAEHAADQLASGGRADAAHR